MLSTACCIRLSRDWALCAMIHRREVGLGLGLALCIMMHRLRGSATPEIGTTSPDSIGFGVLYTQQGIGELHPLPSHRCRGSGALLHASNWGCLAAE